jgi:hypothetical protein
MKNLYIAHLDLDYLEGSSEKISIPFYFDESENGINLSLVDEVIEEVIEGTRTTNVNYEGELVGLVTPNEEIFFQGSGLWLNEEYDSTLEHTNSF